MNPIKTEQNVAFSRSRKATSWSKPHEKQHKATDLEQGHGKKGAYRMSVCWWCNLPEPCTHYHPAEDADFICSQCSQLLLGCSQEKLVELQRKCQAKGYYHKVEALKSFIGELEYVPKARKVRSGMVRERPLRTARPARYQVRA